MPNSIIYVHNRRTLCFSCTTCDRDLSWNLTSYQGHKWTGKTGEHIHSGSSLPFRAEVLANGTLMILNSSLVFSPTHLGTLSLESSGNLSVYNIYIQGKLYTLHNATAQFHYMYVAMLLYIYRGSGSRCFMHKNG